MHQIWLYILLLDQVKLDLWNVAQIAHVTEAATGGVL